MKKKNKLTIVVFLVITSLLAACSQAVATTAQTSTPLATPVPLTVMMPVPLTVNKPVPLPVSGDLVPGTYFMAKIPSTADYSQVIFTLPAGWAVKDGHVYKHLDQPDRVSFSAWIVDKVYEDPCHWQTSALSPLDLHNHYHDPVLGLILAPENEGLANQTLRGARPRTLTQAILGGEIAYRIDLSIPANLDISTCDWGQFRSWTGKTIIGEPNSHDASGQLDTVYMVDLDRRPLVIDASHMPSTSVADLAELNAILASMIIDRSDPIDAPTSASTEQNESPAYLSIEPDVTAVVQGTLLDPETYTYVNVDGQGFNIRFTVPSGWTWNGRYLSKGGFDQPDRANIFFYGGLIQVYADPCLWGTSQSVPSWISGSSIKSLMTAIVNQPMRSVTTPVERPASSLGKNNIWLGMAVELNSRDDFNPDNCYDAQYRSWGPEINFRSHVDTGQRDYVWAVNTLGNGLDQNGDPLLIIDAASFPGTPSDVMSEIEAILDSIIVGHWG